MGYFNYFIKCIIRNIAYRLCKPKVFLTVLLSVIILFGLKHFGYCALDDTDYEMIADGFATITSNQGTMISQLSSMGVDVDLMQKDLTEINTLISGINSSTSNISDKVSVVISRLENLNSNIVNIYNKLGENQKELIQTIETNNQEVLSELQLIRDALNGSDDEVTSFIDNGTINTSTSGEWDLWRLKCVSLNYENQYIYTIKVYYSNPYDTKWNIFAWASDNLIPEQFSTSDYVSNFSKIGEVPKYTNNFVVEYRVPSSNMKYIYFNWAKYITKIEVTRSIDGLAENMNYGNELQQQGNQLQQEQNDFLKDDNVDTEGFEFATNDTNNPTEDGFNTLFTSIYNAFCNTSSAPLTVTLPYVNETFTIQPNLVSNAMQKCGLGVVATLIQSFYYYGVCLFIYKDINKIIEHLKSGNLTADCGNVKTEVL